jgi:ribosome biogenesis GTPase
LRCSAKIDSNLDKLLDLLGGKISIIVGQSGVGKSTIINKLTSTAQQRTAEVSDKSGEGRHTTVNSVMLSLSNGGAVIDSPGVRDYAPALQSPADVVHGFKEIGDASQGCRFANCRHLREPGCAVIAAIDDDSISARRYESYRRSLALAEKLAKR